MPIGPSSLVDLDRYPINRLDTPDGMALVERLRNDLENKALAFLPGFLPPDVLERGIAEFAPLIPDAHRHDRMRRPWGWMDNRGFPDDHPRRAMHRTRGGMITRDMPPADNLWQPLFAWPDLTEFVRWVLGFETLHCSADPYLALEIHIEGEGDGFAWHYDTNDDFVSLLLQFPDEGGHFQYVPFLPNEDDEHFDEVARVFDGNSSRIEQLPIEPETFTLFRGRRSVHRVTTVGTTRQPRLIALFSYDRGPMMVFPERTHQAAIKPDNAPHYGTPAS
tara:strand:+ start:3476 stop:4306 length:831 start_codon:yes stop_codon:yes gene_type:complete